MDVLLYERKKSRISRRFFDLSNWKDGGAVNWNGYACGFWEKAKSSVSNKTEFTLSFDI